MPGDAGQPAMNSPKSKESDEGTPDGTVYWLSKHLGWQPTLGSEMPSLWVVSAIAKDSDHEHCAGCWEKFGSGTKFEGKIFATNKASEVAKHFVCENCWDLMKKVKNGERKVTSQ